MNQIAHSDSLIDEIKPICKQELHRFFEIPSAVNFMHWKFSFIHQTSEGANLFKVEHTDIALVDVKDVFYQVHCPAPASSTRTSVLKLRDEDFRKVEETFKTMHD